MVHVEETLGSMSGTGKRGNECEIQVGAVSRPVWRERFHFLKMKDVKESFNIEWCRILFSLRSPQGCV